MEAHLQKDKERREMGDSKNLFRGRFLSVEEVMVNGHPREVVRKKSAVCFLLYDKQTQSIIIIMQPRAPFVIKDNPGSGLCMELPAGHVERDDIREDVVREAYEEVGAKFSKEQVRLIYGGNQFTVSPGWTDEKIALAYVELQPGQLNENKSAYGLENEGEFITRLRTSINELKSFVPEDLKTFALIQWFLRKLDKDEERRREHA